MQRACPLLPGASRKEYKVIFDVDTVHTTIEDISSWHLKGLCQYLTYEEEICLLHEGQDGVKIMSGLLQHVTSWAEQNEIEYEVRGNEYPLMNRTTPDKDKFREYGIELRPYQLDALESCFLHGRGVVKSPTGSGKTVMQGYLMSELGGPSLLLVGSLVQLDQLSTAFKRDCGIDVQIIGRTKELDPTGHTLSTVATAMSRLRSGDRAVRNLLRNAVLLQYDEGHHLGARTWATVGGNCHAKYRFAWSATPFAKHHQFLTHSRDAQLIGVTGPLICEIPTEVLMDQGFVERPLIYVYQYPIDEKLDGGSNDYHYIYDTGIMENEPRNLSGAIIATCCVLMGYKTMMLVRRIPHGHTMMKLLAQHGITSAFARGSNIMYKMDSSGEIYETSSDTFVEEFVSGEIQVGIGSTRYDEVVDIPAANALVIMASGKSDYATLQRVGRIMRRKGEGGNGKRPIVVDFDDSNLHYVLKNHVGSRVRMYEKEGYEIRRGIPRRFLDVERHLARKGVRNGVE